jgi:hypothetical protein
MFGLMESRIFFYRLCRIAASCRLRQGRGGRVYRPCISIDCVELRRHRPLDCQPIMCSHMRDVHNAAGRLSRSFTVALVGRAA